MRIVPVTPARWPDMEKLFTSMKGDPPRCFCMWPRQSSAEWAASSRSQRKRAMERLVERGPPPGLLAYEKGEPVGWVSVAPREAQPRIERSRISRSPDGAPAWAIACYVVHPDWRGKGLMAKLTDAAAAYAKKRGATLVEAFPVTEPDFAGCDGFQGVASTLASCGFEEIARPTPGRAYMRKRLR
jgi:GNAT superfamily N-acetyltransferase